MRGQSLRPMIENPQQPGHEFVVSEMANGPRLAQLHGANEAVQVHGLPRRNRPKPEMLFDLQADPGEMKNLADQASFAAEVMRHRALLADWNKLTEEASHPIQAAPNPKKNKTKQKQRKKG